MGIPQVPNTLRQGAALPKLNDYGVDVEKGMEAVHTTAIGVRDGIEQDQSTVEASIALKMRVETVELYHLNHQFGLYVCGRTGEVLPDIRQVTHAPGKGYTGMQAGGRQGRMSDPSPVVMRKSADGREIDDSRVPSIDTSAEKYWFQAQGILPIHGIIGVGPEGRKQPDKRRSWTLQGLRVKFVALLEERFKNRMDLQHGWLGGQYDAAAPPNPGLIPWQDMVVETILADLKVAQRRAAAKPNGALNAAQLFAAYTKAELNAYALKERFQAWRDGKSYEPLDEWMKRREGVFKAALGRHYVDMGAVIAPPDRPVDLKAERERVLAEMKGQFGEEMRRLKAEHDAELQAEREKLAKLQEQLAEAKSAGITVTGKLSAGEDDDSQLEPANMPAAWRKGRQAALDGRPRENEYSRGPHVKQWLEGYDSISAPSQADE